MIARNKFLTTVFFIFILTASILLPVAGSIEVFPSSGYSSIELVHATIDASGSNTTMALHELVDKELPMVEIIRDGAIYDLYDLIAGVCDCRFKDVFGDFVVYDGLYEGAEYKAIKSSNGIAVVGENGYVYFRLGDGKSIEIKSYEEVVKNATNRLYYGIGDRCRYDDIIGSDYRLVYQGMSGKGKREVIMGIEVYPNGTTRRLDEKTSELVNPYDVYYVYIAGYRIEPPIIIRAVDPFKTQYDTKIQYLKAFLPEAKQYKKIKITRSIVDKMIEIYTSQTNSDSSSIYIYDIYLTVSRDNKYLLPTLKVKAIDSSVVFWFQITWDGDVEVLASAVFSGSASPSPDQYTMMEGDEIFNKLLITNVYMRGDYSNEVNPKTMTGYIILTVLILTVGVVVAFIIYHEHRHGS